MVIYIFFNVEPVLGDLDGRLRAQSLKPHLHLLSGWRPEIPRNTSTDWTPWGHPTRGCSGAPGLCASSGKGENSVHASARVGCLALHCYVAESHAELGEVRSFPCQSDHNDLVVVQTEKERREFLSIENPQHRSPDFRPWAL